MDFAPGLIGPAGFLTFATTKVHSAPVALGVTGGPAFGVTVPNTVRLAARVVAVTLHTSVVGVTSFDMPFSPPIPHPIDVSDRSTWFFRINEAIGLVAAAGRCRPALEALTVLFANQVLTAPALDFTVSASGELGGCRPWSEQGTPLGDGCA